GGTRWGREATPACIALIALGGAPAIILSPFARGGSVINLLDLRLADIAEEKITGCAVEAEAPRVAQPVGPDLRARSRLMSERIIRRDGILLPRRGVVNVEAQDLPQQRILPLTIRRVAAPAITDPHIEIAVVAEEQQSPVVIRHRVRHGENRVGTGGGGTVRISLRDPVAHNEYSAVEAGVVHKEIAIARVTRVKDDAQQSALCAQYDQIADIQKWLWAHSAVRSDDHDASGLLHDVHAIR